MRIGDLSWDRNDYVVVSPRDFHTVLLLVSVAAFCSRFFPHLSC